MPIKRFNYEIGHTQHAVLGASFPGTISVLTATPQVPYVGDGFICQTLRCRLKTAPTGAAAIIQIKKNGSNFGTAVTIAAADNEGSQTQVGLMVSDGDYFEADITQVGSTVAGADLVWMVSER